MLVEQSGFRVGGSGSEPGVHKFGGRLLEYHGRKFEMDVNDSKVVGICIMPR